jgi:hypothetical protein
MAMSISNKFYRKHMIESDCKKLYGSFKHSGK